MNKIFIKICLFLGSLLLLLPGATSAQYYLWEIGSFDVQFDVQKDSSIIVTEKIQANFNSSNPKHGIIRYIPVKYKNGLGQNLNLRFSLIDITDQNQNQLTYERTFNGDFIDLKIGDADITLTTPQTYLIKYKLERGINSFEDHDELYWNVTGNGWDTSIEKATATVNLPEKIAQNKLKATCFTGVDYSTEKECQVDITTDGTIKVQTDKKLESYAGLTIVVGFPKGTVNFPDQATLILWFLLDNWGYLIPLLTLIAMTLYWYYRGRDPQAKRSTIMPHYEPPRGILPAEAGTLIDNHVNIHDITSTIIDLAVHGYLIIHETKNKGLLWENITYQFEKTTPKKSAKTLNSYEQKVYDAIFTDSSTKVDLTELKNKFYTHIKGIEDDIYSKLVKDGYYSRNPRTIRDTFTGIGCGVGFFLIFLAGALIDVFGVSLMIGLMLSCFIIFLFSFIMPQRTKEGMNLYYEVLGLEEFIKTAEKDRMKFYENENIFEKLLPYAISFQLTDKWANACKDIFKTKPNWYTSTDPSLNSLNTFTFINSFNHFSNTLSTNMTSAPRSSGSSASGGSSGFGGGGFSGGGFGGGGGSSW
ncbi:MAG: DUF2207 domain-containing protein [Candidatus Altimarinota bacterium]